MLELQAAQNLELSLVVDISPLLPQAAVRLDGGLSKLNYGALPRTLSRVASKPRFEGCKTLRIVTIDSLSRYPPSTFNIRLYRTQGLLRSEKPLLNGFQLDLETFDRSNRYRASRLLATGRTQVALTNSKKA
jgi:hypothetical protein